MFFSDLAGTSFAELESMKYLILAIVLSYSSLSRSQTMRTAELVNEVKRTQNLIVLARKEMRNEFKQISVWGQDSLVWDECQSSIMFNLACQKIEGKFEKLNRKQQKFFETSYHITNYQFRKLIDILNQDSTLANDLKVKFRSHAFGTFDIIHLIKLRNSSKDIFHFSGTLKASLRSQNKKCYDDYENSWVISYKQMKCIKDFVSEDYSKQSLKKLAEYDQFMSVSLEFLEQMEHALLY